MRVIGGSARGRKLKPPPAGVRPTSDLIRGVIFDALIARGANLSRVLDLYAGSGALGIEALSRGGGECDFVEREPKSAAVIGENLRLTGFTEHGRVHRIAVERAAERLSGPYSLVLADPPYNDETAGPALDAIARSPLVDRRTTLVLEHSSRHEPPPSIGILQLVWTRRHGDTEVSIYGSENPH